MYKYNIAFKKSNDVHLTVFEQWMEVKTSKKNLTVAIQRLWKQEVNEHTIELFYLKTI